MGRGFQYLQQLSFVVLSVTPDSAEPDRLTRQRSGDEYGLAAAHDAIALVSQSGYRPRLGGLVLQPARSRAQAGASQARRNSPKCGSDDSRSSVFTRATSSAWRSRVSRPRMSSNRR